jgi:hypothetical protein
LEAGIASEENLEMVKAKEYHYLYVSPNRLKDYQTIRDWLSVLPEKRKTQVTGGKPLQNPAMALR